MKKKIVIVTTIADTLNLLRGYGHFLSDDYEVHYISSPSDLHGELRSSEGVRTHSVAMVRGFGWLKDLVSLVRLLVTIRKIKPAIIHSYTPKAGFLSMAAGLLLRVPVRIHSFTGLLFPTATGLRRMLFITIDKVVCYCATVVIAESAGVQRELIGLGIRSDIIKRIGFGHISGVDVRYFSRAKARDIWHVDLGTSENFRFLFIGRFHRDKGIKELLDAFLALPSNATLVLVGSFDSEGPLERSTLNKICGSERVHVIEAVRDVRPYLFSSDCLVLPSYREGFPNVILEAGAMELPVISTDVFGADELVVNDVTGYIVPRYDVAALEEAMLKMMGLSVERRQSMADRLRRMIVQRFNRCDVYRRHQEFYNEMLVSRSEMSG